MHRTRVGLMVVGLALLVAACGDDGDDGGSTSTTAAAATTTGAETTAAPETTESSETTDGEESSAGEAVAIVGIDYGYEGVPAEIAAGDEIVFTNDGEELHEIVAVPIPDEFADMSIEEILALPEEEQPETPPVFVTVALPGGEPGAVVEGDAAVFTEPGRYALLCFLPVGNDPADFLPYFPGGDQEGEDPPDELFAGEPHVAAGMAAEVTVTE